MDLPRFKSPEEELSYLRAHVAEREAELIREGHFEYAGENAASEVISRYKEIPSRQVLPKEQIVGGLETAKIVLRLKPESHDTIMDELLGVMMEKGIKNALSVVEAMGSPHIDDDFHRLLVQYLKSGQNIPGLKEGMPMYKSLNMTLFEVSLPACFGVLWCRCCIFATR